MSYEQDREDMAAGEGMFDRESTESEALEAIQISAEEEEHQAERDYTEKLLREYAAAVKQYGKALIDLGRACDPK